MSYCPSCGGEDVAVIETTCMDTEWGVPNGEVLAFSVCPNCDYGINEHTEGVCDCPKEKPDCTLCGRPFIENEYGMFCP